MALLMALGLRPRDRPARRDNPRGRPSWSPGAARQPTRQLMSTTHTYRWLIPIITWCWQFPSLSTNILLIKSKLKLEPRAIVVGVAMSPRNLGGKYRCRPHPRWRKCTRQFFPGTRACQSNYIRVASSLAWRQHRRSCGVFKSWISVAHCPCQWKWRVLHIRYFNPYLNRSVCLLMGSPTWWRFTFCSSGSSLVFWWRDAPLVREFQMWGRRYKQWDSH